MARITYAYGYKSREQAQESLDDSLAHDEVSMCEHPQIETYRVDGHALELSRKSPVRYRITINV